MNQIIIIGKCEKLLCFNDNLGKKIVNLIVKVQRDYKEKDGNIKEDSFTVVLFDEKAEFIEKYFEKGRMVSVVGEFQNHKDLKDNVTYLVSRIIADEIEYTEWNTNNEAKKTTNKTTSKISAKVTT